MTPEDALEGNSYKSKVIYEDLIQYRVDWKFGRSIYLRSDPPAIRAIPICARFHAPLNDNATQTLTAKIKFRMLVLGVFGVVLSFRGA